MTYWISAGLPLNYQNQTTAWALGGDQVVFDGHGVGTFDGNGQLWLVLSSVLQSSSDDVLFSRYDLTDGVSNFPGRPISLMIVNSTNSHYTGIRFVQVSELSQERRGAQRSADLFNHFSLSSGPLRLRTPQT